MLGRWVLLGIIGRASSPLVSARSYLLYLYTHLVSFAQDYLIIKNLGFPEFTQFFNHSFLWKLQKIRMNLTMAISTKHKFSYPSFGSY